LEDNEEIKEANTNYEIDFDFAIIKKINLDENISKGEINNMSKIEPIIIPIDLKKENIVG